MKEREAEEDKEETGRGRKCKGWFEQGGCALPINVDCWL